ncbi:MAG: hypothetical protein PVJ67_01990 [Candidatus Pacearchaeota archaeon]|jgi:hypothetical protein
MGFENHKLKDSIDFGPEMHLRFGVYKTKGVSDKKVEKIFNGMKEELEAYAIKPEVAWIRDFKRGGFFFKSIFDSIIMGGAKIEKPCDRNLYLVEKNLGDYLWGLSLLPEISGAVDTMTHSLMYLSADQGFSRGPVGVAKHEVLHACGCEQGLAMNGSYEIIKKLKNAKSECDEINPFEDFFPGYYAGNPKKGIKPRIYFTRESVNKRFE